MWKNTSTTTVETRGTNTGSAVSFVHAQLVQEFERRRRKNPKYSLRAYGRSLGVDHSLLSKIIRGQRPLSIKLIFQIGLGLGIDEFKLRAIIHSLEIIDNSYHNLSE